MPSSPDLSAASAEAASALSREGARLRLRLSPVEVAYALGLLGAGVLEDEDAPEPAEEAA